MLHYADSPPQHTIRHKFSERGILWDKTLGQRTVRDLKKYVPNKTTTFSLECCCQNHFCPELFCLLNQSSSLQAQLLSKKPWTKTEFFESFDYVDTDNTFQNTKLTTAKTAFCSYEPKLPCALHNEVWFSS